LPYALQATIPHLTRSSVHRCLKRRGISRLPQVEGDTPDKRKFKVYPIGYFHIVFQADAFGGYNKLYEADRKPGPIVEAACWVHARRPFFAMADLAENARRTAQGRTPGVISPLALEAVRRIDALFEIERSINGQSGEQRRAIRRELSAPWSPIWKAGCASSVPSSRAATISPRRWITCSIAGRPSPTSSMTDGSVSRTTRRNERCAASRSAESHGCSPVPIAAGSAPPRCIA
jgi:hypothetical protein